MNLELFLIKNDFILRILFCYVYKDFYFKEVYRFRFRVEMFFGGYYLIYRGFFFKFFLVNFVGFLSNRDIGFNILK